MPGDPFRQMKPGDRKIPAEGYNLAIQAAQDWQNKRNSQNADGSRETAQQFVYVKNNSGADCSRFDILGISSVLISPSENLNEFKAKLAFVGTTPDEDDHTGKFVVLLEPLAAGSIGRAVATGLVQVRLSVPAGSEDITTADVVTGSRTYLRASSAGSATILANTSVEAGNEDGSESSSDTAPVWAVVRLGGGSGIEIIEGYLNTPLAAPSDPISAPTTAALDVYRKVNGTYQVYGAGKTVTNRDPTLTGDDGVFCMAVRIDDEYRPIWVGCPEASSS